MTETAVFLRVSTVVVLGLAAIGPLPSDAAEKFKSNTPSVGLTPLTDLGAARYLDKFEGGLYPGGNTMPKEHAEAGLARARAIRPLDAEGQPDPSGKYVLLSIGYSNPNLIFCDPKTGIQQFRGDKFSPDSFIGQAAADPEVNHSTLAIMHGCNPANVVDSWDEPTDANYDRIRDNILVSHGLSEKQVQVVWCMMIVGRGSRNILPDENADAYQFVKGLGNILRTLKLRYPNLQQVFLASQLYCGHCNKPESFPIEPISYEGAFGVKWLIEAQMRQMKGGAIHPQAGNLDCEKGVAPWVAWGSYLWADGIHPRADGLSWPREDFIQDGTHPGPSGVKKAGRMLLDFFKTEPSTRPWFVKS